MNTQKQFYSDELKKNFKNTWKMLSFWVVAAASAAAQYWLSLDHAAQAELLAQYPVLSKVAPTLTLLCWVWARIKPQASITPPPEKTE